jgi:hypothetical protein
MTFLSRTTITKLKNQTRLSFLNETDATTLTYQIEFNDSSIIIDMNDNKTNTILKYTTTDTATITNQCRIDVSTTTAKLNKTTATPKLNETTTDTAASVNQSTKD